MKQCLTVLLSNLLIAQRSSSNYLVSYGKTYELPDSLSKLLSTQMDDKRLGVTRRAGTLSLLSQPEEQPGWAPLVGDVAHTDEKPFNFQGLETD